METLDQVTIYTDGGAAPNPGPGGWAALLIAASGVERVLSGAEPNTTNNRMELTAAVEALRALKRPCAVEFYTDSQYLRRGITEWLPGWQAAGWQRKRGEVANLDLWQALSAETRRHQIAWRWVKGHAGNEHNERVDRLATAARERIAPPAPPRPGDDSATRIALRVSAPPGGVGGWAARLAPQAASHSRRSAGAPAPRAATSWSWPPRWTRCAPCPKARRRAFTARRTICARGSRAGSRAGGRAAGPPRPASRSSTPVCGARSKPRRRAGRSRGRPRASARPI